MSNPPATAPGDPPRTPITIARALLRAMRPTQWSKNVLVFAALAFDDKLLNPFYLARTVVIFLVMCALASAVYLINDLADIEKDRRHPRKKHRPLASGALPKNIAIAAVVVLLLPAIPVAFLIDLWAGGLALFYIAKNLAYSAWLKKIVIIDVMVLAINYLVRVAIGVVVIDAERFSPWLYVCVGLGALFIGLGKRRHEVSLVNNGSAGNIRDVLQHYNLVFIDNLIVMVTTATLIAYSLYTFSDAPNLPPNNAMMLTIPIVMYALFRYLYLVHVEQRGGAPDELVFQDRPFFASVIVWGLTVVVMLYLL